MRRLFLLLLLVVLAGCATTQETSQLSQQIAMVQHQCNLQRTEANEKLNGLAKDVDNLRRQFLSLSTSIEGNDQKVKELMGRVDELSHRMDAARTARQPSKTSDTRKPFFGPSADQPAREPAEAKPEYEEQYKEAFNAFQKGDHQEAVRLFRGFVENTPEVPLKANAFYWIGESYIYLKEYEKAVLAFQEVVDKYPKSDKVPRAMLSQAEAFGYMKDRKSAETILKKIIEAYPKTEEAAIAERRLRSIASMPDTSDEPRAKAEKGKGKLVVVTSDAANLRQKPLRSASIIAWIIKGSEYTVMEESTDQGGKKWYKVRTKSGKEGWIHEALVKVRDK